MKKICMTESRCCIAEIKHNIVNQLCLNSVFKKGIRIGAIKK